MFCFQYGGINTNVAYLAHCLPLNTLNKVQGKGILLGNFEKQIKAEYGQGSKLGKATYGSLNFPTWLFFVLSQTALPEGQEAIIVVHSNIPVVKTPREILSFGQKEQGEGATEYCRTQKESFKRRIYRKGYPNPIPKTM